MTPTLAPLKEMGLMGFNRDATQTSEEVVHQSPLTILTKSPHVLPWAAMETKTVSREFRILFQLLPFVSAVRGSAVPPLCRYILLMQVLVYAGTTPMQLYHSTRRGNKKIKLRCYPTSPGNTYSMIEIQEQEPNSPDLMGLESEPNW